MQANRSRVERKLLKDGEHLGILGPAELSFANEGGWWLVRLCLYLGRVYMGHLCTLGFSSTLKYKVLLKSGVEITPI